MSRPSDAMDLSDEKVRDALAAEAFKALEEISAPIAEASKFSSTDDIASRTERVLSTYHASAAVLATFDEQTLVPFREVAAFADASKATLLSDCQLLRDGRQRDRWTLLLEVRRIALRLLGDVSSIRAAIELNKDNRPAGDPAQEMFEAYLRGTAPALDSQTSSQIAGTLQAVEWLEGLDLVTGLPPTAVVRSRSEFLALVQPLHDIAGDDFAGRAEEMMALRDHVGVLPAESFGGRLNQIAAQIFNLQQKPPLFIWGPGGRGKSTLVSHFLWEHAMLPAEQRFPWAYLDFDRPGLLAEEPLTLLIEVLRQVGIQYPQARASCDGLRRSWVQKLSDRPAEFKQLMSKSVAQQHSARATMAYSNVPEITRCLQDFARLLNHFKLESAPFLLVLDTFEEVQYRSEAVVRGLWEFLELFQQQVPRLRTVVAGRARLPALGSLPRSELELEDFDALAALHFLQMKGIRNRDDARKVFDFVGGNPLSLRLAAETWHRDGAGAFGQSLPRKLFSFFVKDNAVQAQLFARILDHIHDPDVRKLAHPGMVLRRITPDVIRYVLAKPCGVDVPDADVAERLFSEMSREVALVKVEGDALVHRADIRRLVVSLLRTEAASKARQVDEAAVAYYSERSNRADLPLDELLVDRAEELYHRLSLQQPLNEIGERWLDGVATHLFSALEELPVREHAWLTSRLGRSLTTEERRIADQDAWERDTLLLARELFRSGKEQKALHAIRERTERLPGSSLYALETEILEKLEKWDELGSLVKIGIDSADAAANRDLAIDLRIRCARFALHAGLLSDARSGLEEAAMLASAGLPLRAIEVRLHLLALLRAERAAGQPAVDNDIAATNVLRELSKELAAVEDAAIRERTALMAWLAAEAAASQPEVVMRIAPLIGMSASFQARLRALAWAIAKLDTTQTPPGMLADTLGAPSAATLTERWTRLVLGKGALPLGKAITDLMVKVPLSAEVTAAIADVFRGSARPILVPGDVLALSERASLENDLVISLAENPRALPGLPSLRLTGTNIRRLRHALLDAFPSRDALASMLSHKLERSLHSFALDESMSLVVFNLIQAASDEKWLPELITAAIEAKPASKALRAIAVEYGLAAELPGTHFVEQTSARFKDPALWAEQLVQIAGRVCHIELHDGGRSGTGFLIGPDLVMTAFHLIEPVLGGAVAPEAITLWFDYKPIDGPLVGLGSRYQLATQWLVAYSPSGALDAEKEAPDFTSDHLDCAILRLRYPAGIEPAGGGRAEPGAPIRGWLRIADRDYSDPSQLLMVVHYPKGESLTFSMGRRAGSNAAGTRLRYDLSTDPGASGAPCFDMDANVVGMHLGSGPEPHTNFAVPASRIVQYLGQANLLWLLNQTLP